MKKRDERRALWRADLEQLAASLGRKLEPWQLDLAAEIFVSRLPRASVTGSVDIWVAAQMAGQRVVKDMEADGRLSSPSGNWPDGHPRRDEYYAHYFPGVRPHAG